MANKGWKVYLSVYGFIWFYHVFPSSRMQHIGIIGTCIPSEPQKMTKIIRPPADLQSPSQGVARKCFALMCCIYCPSPQGCLAEHTKLDLPGLNTHSHQTLCQTRVLIFLCLQCRLALHIVLYIFFVVIKILKLAGFCYSSATPPSFNPECCRGLRG